MGYTVTLGYRLAGNLSVTGIVQILPGVFLDNKLGMIIKQFLSDIVHFMRFFTINYRVSQNRCDRHPEFF
jgi:hypothetical protein